MNRDVITYTGISATSGMALFVEQSLTDIAIWLLVVFCVIMADLCMGVYKCYKRGQIIRVSKGLRDTMGKIAAYFSFVVVAVFCEVVFKSPELDEWACGFIIGGETLSICGNYCKSQGYTLNVNKLFDAFGGKAKGIITKDDTSQPTGQA